MWPVDQNVPLRTTIRTYFVGESFVPPNPFWIINSELLPGSEGGNRIEISTLSKIYNDVYVDKH